MRLLLSSTRLPLFILVLIVTGVLGSKVDLEITSSFMRLRNCTAFVSQVTHCTNGTDDSDDDDDDDDENDNSNPLG